MVASRSGAGSTLYAELRAVVGGEVATDPTTLATHSTDASNYRHVPLAVVAPRTTADVIATLQTCARQGVPVLARGAATSVGGQATNEAVILDFTRHLNRVLEIDPVARTARVQPGVVLDDLRSQANEHGLTFGPDPSTHNRATVGGMIGNNACGSHSVAWGKTVDNVRSLEIALVDGTRLEVGPTSPAELERLCRLDDVVGELYRRLRALRDDYLADIRTGFPRLVRRVSGYNLEYLLPERGFDLAKALVGTEGTCAVLLGAVVDLVPAPAGRALTVIGFEDGMAAADAGHGLLDLPVLTVEGIDEELVTAFEVRTGRRAELPPGAAWLLVETGGADTAEAARQGARVAERAACLGGSPATLTEPDAQRAAWRIREEGAGLATRLSDGSEAWSGWEDAAVPPERLGAYLREFRTLLDEHGRRGVVYGHFGDGCLHVRIDFPFTGQDARGAYRRFMEDAARLVVAHGGSLSGEHGDGQARAELLPLMYSERLIAAFGAFKHAFDPRSGLNPGRVVDPAPLDADLRVVVAPPVLPTRANLALHADGGDLAAASRRCVGVGKCISTSSSSVMCPSYRATGQEQHSTRGRARLLFEMLAGSVVTGGWRSTEVRDALDLCLGCKACKSDCPVGVDMATYRSEFLSRHYRHRLRPAAHYSMGALPLWLRLGSGMPGVVNAVTRSRLGPLLKRVGGVDPAREIPPVAATSFRRWFAGRPVPAGPVDGAEALVWPDTFTNYFDPHVGRDAVAVLESRGQRVQLPDGPVCCGLTWYSTGRLDTARRVLRRSLDALAPWLERGVPIVGLEPSCTAMLRTDAAELLPDDPRVPLLQASVRTFAEHVVAGPPLDVVARGGRAVTQVHCHQHADLGHTADETLLEQVVDDVEVLREGCCGLAGNFGFERGHHAVSVAVAEHQLLPALRRAEPGTVVHADGFSCRTQVRQLSGHAPVHLATLLARALGLSGT